MLWVSDWLSYDTEFLVADNFLFLDNLSLRIFVDSLGAIWAINLFYMILGKGTPLVLFIIGRSEFNFIEYVRASGDTLLDFWLSKLA